jgi:hypothetical protein
MTLWVLILTLSTSGSNYSGQSIHSVDFGTEESCKFAGAKWKEALHKSDQSLASYICAPKQTK